MKTSAILPQPTAHFKAQNTLNCPKRGSSVKLGIMGKYLGFKKELVGAIGIEPTTPTVSRQVNNPIIPLSYQYFQKSDALVSRNFTASICPVCDQYACRCPWPHCKGAA